MGRRFGVLDALAQEAPAQEAPITSRRWWDEPRCEEQGAGLPGAVTSCNPGGGDIRCPGGLDSGCRIDEITVVPDPEPRRLPPPPAPDTDVPERGSAQEPGGGGGGSGGGSRPGDDGSSSGPDDEACDPEQVDRPAECEDEPGEELPEEPGEEEPAAAPWDVLDWVSLGLSLDAFVQDPSLENLGWLLLDVAGALLPVLPALGLARNADRLIGSANAELAQKAIFVSTPNGSVVPIPKGMEGRVADNGRGIIFQKPDAPESGQFKNRDMVRIMDPTDAYPNGRLIYYDANGNPLDRYGVGGQRRDAWHHDLGSGDPLPGYQKFFERLNK